MISPIIRSANLQDCPRLAELCTQLGYPSTSDQLTYRLPAILEHNDHAIFVAEVNGSISGWVHVHILPTLDMDQIAELGGVVVDESVRGQGVGKILMEQAEIWARQHDCNQLWLRSNVIRKETHCFYQALGYEILKTSYTFHKHL
jgi:N-acetylglutamate synthase-like GNAT family acetyltransferase